MRYASGEMPTGYSFTGQYSHQSDFGLMFYNARWYDPYITHFTQPDSIVPDPYNSQDWNRYSYARYNPVRYADPSGHKVVEDIITGNTTSTKKQDEDPKYKKLNWFRKWAGYGSHTGCELSYKECFYDYSLLKLTDYQQVDSDQFDDLVYAVYYDLKKHDPGKYNPFDWMVRKHYDTPFWNGVYADKSDPDFVRIKPNPDNVVCVESRCNKRSDINYFAQGMWDAAMGRTLEQSLKTAQDYKEETYPGQTLSDDAEYWIEYGYQAYQALDAAPTNP